MVLVIVFGLISVGIGCFGYGAFSGTDGVVSHDVIVLLRGFAPLLSLPLIVFLASLILSFIASSAEHIFKSHGANVPRREKKIAWRTAHDYLIPVYTFYCSLKEHSPPAVSFL